MYLGTSDEPRPQRIVAYSGDGRLVAIEGDAAFTVQQVEDFNSAVLIAHSDVNAIRRRTEEAHFVFLALQDQNLDKRIKSSF